METESYQVIARKYRPQQFGEVVGQSHITQTLQNALSLQRVAHAYLFVGPRGTGKTTMARIFAKALNCTAGRPGHPCDACENCAQIREGRALDVIEIDGASNNSVDQVRDLRDSARYLPAQSPFKIYIIDEVHMLSTGAFNALLKTLEEPPPHVKFIFATTDPQKLPATIISRCQRFDLRRISTRDIASHLRLICGKEGVEITDDALAAIARGAEGGLRDAESALDQLIAFRGKKITEEDVLSVFGLISRQRLEDLARALLAGDVPAILSLLDEFDQRGTDLKRVLVELIEWFRHLLAWIHVQNAEALDLPEALAAGLKAAAGATDAGRAMRMIEALLVTEAELRYAMSPRIIMDIGLMRTARAATTVSIDQLIREIAALKSGASLPPTPPAPPTPPVRTPTPSAPSVREEPDVPAPTKHSAAGESAASWPDLAGKISKVYPRLTHLLKDSRLEMGQDEHAVLHVNAAKDSELQGLQDSELLKKIEKLILRDMNARVRLTVRATPSPSSPTRGHHESEQDSMPEKAPATAPPPAKGRNIRKQAQDHPTVQNLMKTFDGVIEDIKE